MSKAKETLLELEQENLYVFHGSGSVIEEFEPRQAYTIEGGVRIPDGDSAVFVSPFVDYAIFMAVVNRINCLKGYRAGTSYDGTNLEFSAKKSTFDQLDEKSRGYVYVFNKSDFTKKKESEWVCYMPIKPLQSIEVSFEDLPPNIKEIPEEGF